MFANGITRFATDLKIDKYVCATYENWDNYEPKDKIATSNKKD